MVKRRKQKGNEGFTLVELIIVIAIMAILSSAVGLAVIRYIQKAREGNVREEARVIYDAGQHAYVNMVASDTDLNLVKTFTKSDGSTVPCGVVTNYHLASVQRGDTINPNAADYCDYLIAKDILESLSSNNQGGDNFLNFHGAVYNPIGMVCSSFSNTYGCPGIIVVYDNEGNIVMLEYYKEKVLIHYEGGEFNVSDSTTFIGTDRIQ
ncbi:MAG: type II secretion system GspH family protein [Clostridium sp.]|nr:type II secretion system GspH family protein [Clostridium sp.]MCM1172119.1 type II secretion system GspH family protein [Clostridium sp.]MCM1209329.1 type II secretion system GspH family protein [Ruminococcus sp.]